MFHLLALVGILATIVGGLAAIASSPIGRALAEKLLSDTPTGLSERMDSLEERQEAIEFDRELDSGFTVIELLIMLVILGILCAIAIPAFSDAPHSEKIDGRQDTTGVIEKGYNPQ